MKRLLAVAAAMVLGIAYAQLGSAASSPTLEARMEDCFRAHAKLMDKPGTRNRADCWRAHAYLMER
jgi:hypothetical protein